MAAVSRHFDKVVVGRSVGNEVSIRVGAGLGTREMAPVARSDRFVDTADGGNMGRKLRDRAGKN